MNPISSFADLINFKLNNENQQFYYVLLINPNDITDAGKIILNNLNLFDLDSGEHCDYFLPGFHNDGNGLHPYCADYEVKGFKIASFVARRGRLAFNDTDFCNFYKELEHRNKIGWHYSGCCELLLLKITNDGSINLDEIISYNLDDIIRNKHTISEFIRSMITLTKQEADEKAIKNQIDELFWEMITPTEHDLLNSDYFYSCKNIFDNNFLPESYCFISYSSKDFSFVNKIRQSLTESGIKCWMAPFDIPRGTNYAYIIELAIKNANKFILMLSHNAVESVWVGKELKRAISRFQLTNPDKLCITWINGKFPLEDTPFALPLEDIQIAVDLKNDIKNIGLLKEILSGCMCENISNYKHSSVRQTSKDAITAINNVILSIKNLNNSTEGLQTYIYALANLTNIQCSYSQEIENLYERLYCIIKSCQTDNRSFTESEFAIFKSDIERLYQICNELLIHLS